MLLILCNALPSCQHTPLFWWVSRSIRAEPQENLQPYCQTAQELKAKLLSDQKAHQSAQKRKAATEAGGDADKISMGEASKGEEDSIYEALEATLKKVTCYVHLPCARKTSDKAVASDCPSMVVIQAAGYQGKHGHN